MVKRLSQKEIIVAPAAFSYPVSGVDRAYKRVDSKESWPRGDPPAQLNIISFIENIPVLEWKTGVEGLHEEIRVIVKWMPRKYGHLPDKQEKVTKTLPEQVEVLCEGWIA